MVDRIGMRYQSEETLLANYRDNGAFSLALARETSTARVDQASASPTFGNPQNFGRSVATNYLLYYVKVDITDSLHTSA